MLRINLNTLKNKIKFQEIGLTSRSCIAGCGCSCASTCSCSCGCGLCNGHFQLKDFNNSLKSIYA